MKTHTPRWENGFTIPGQDGYSERVLELAQKWGADAIRNSDGTTLPGCLAKSDYKLYSNIYLIRKDNDWIRKHPHVIQQVVKTSPSIQAAAVEQPLSITLLSGDEAVRNEVDGSQESLDFWQVFDRTEERLLETSEWTYQEDTGEVVIHKPLLWHTYSVNFLAYNTWEFIHWYNHTTNNWDDEPQMPMNPFFPEVRDRMKENLEIWLEANADADVARFTTFYFNNHGAFTDYSATVSKQALRLFKEKHGYIPQAETFTRGGQFNHVAQQVNKEYMDWVNFVHDFFVEITPPYIEMVQKAGKKAVFLLGDQLVGSEPYSEGFRKLNMDGGVSAVFNGFEVRQIGDLEAVPVKEIRFHPYFFPREVTGKPTFSEGGEPLNDLKLYWRDVRRACLRVCINRIGFGGMISLLDEYPEFVEYVEELSKQSSAITDLHLEGNVWQAPVTVGILGLWGNLRSWTYGGHLNYNSMYDNLLEAISGLPVKIRFISFDEILEGGIPAEIDVLVNCGREGTSLSGGDYWGKPELTDAFFDFVNAGGGFIGIGEPSALVGKPPYRFQLAPMLGVDRDSLLTEANVRCDQRCVDGHFITEDLSDRPLELVNEISDLKLTSGRADVVKSRIVTDCERFYEHRRPQLITNTFGGGRSVYLSGFKYNFDNTRLLSRMLYWVAGKENEWPKWQTDNPLLECAWFPKSEKLVVVNNSNHVQTGSVIREDGTAEEIEISPLGMNIIQST